VEAKEIPITHWHATRERIYIYWYNTYWYKECYGWSISKSDVKGLETGSITNHINQSYQQAQASSSPAPTEIKNFKIKESLVPRCFEENS
jgi:hypothetical protein